MAAWTAVGQNYLPLDTGNQWIYRSGALATVAEVVASNSYGGQTYWQVRGLPGGAGDVWLRGDEAGRLWQWDRAGARESVWLDLAAGLGQSVETGVNPCVKASRVETREGRYTGPVGYFETAVVVRYDPGNCADAGLDGDSWLDWVGLLRRTEVTIAGPRTWELVYARLGTATVITSPELSFTLSLDRSVYTANLMPPISRTLAVPTMAARMTLRNTSEDAVELAFPTGQQFELVIRNEKGDEVYRWSDGRAFIQMVTTQKLAKGEKNWAVTVRLGAAGSDQALPAGRYTAEAWVTTTGEKRFAATAGFEIRHVH